MPQHRQYGKEEGFLSFSALFWVLVLAAGVFLALRLLPPYINNYELQDSINNIALNASYSQLSEEEIMKNVVAKAKGEGIDLAPKQISILKGGGTVEIAVRYSVPVDLLVRQVVLHFEPSASNRNIMSK